MMYNQKNVCVLFCKADYLSSFFSVFFTFSTAEITRYIFRVSVVTAISDMRWRRVPIGTALKGSLDLVREGQAHDGGFGREEVYDDHAVQAVY